MDDEMQDQEVEAVAEPEDPAHAEWLERVKRDEEAEAEAQAKREADARADAEANERSLAEREGAVEEPVAAEDDE